MKRLIVATALLLATAQTGQASLETDCYFGGGYFDATYFDDDYFDETCSASPPGNAADTKPRVTIRGVSIGL